LLLQALASTVISAAKMATRFFIRYAIPFAKSVI
jgi:hypothetical protein